MLPTAGRPRSIGTTWRTSEPPAVGLVPDALAVDSAFEPMADVQWQRPWDGLAWAKRLEANEVRAGAKLPEPIPGCLNVFSSSLRFRPRLP